MSKDKQTDAPLWQALQNHAEQNIISFHMPGHKHGWGMEKGFAQWLGKGVLSIDLTEIPGTDDLHLPQGPIKKAQELAAQAFGADRTFFLVNGTSCGVQAMILATCNPGDKIILPRNVHRSILGGLILSGAVPIYLEPEVHEGIALGLTSSQVEEKLLAYPDAKAVLLVSPTYYGIVPDLNKIAETVHFYDIPLLVDEAHGPHLDFHSFLPTSSLKAGADMAAQGAHKLLSCLTQASLLHMNGERVDLNRVENSLRILQTTSPSYLLMASLDTARRQLALEGEKIWDKTLDLVKKTRKKIKKIAGFSCWGEEFIEKNGVFQLDLTKLTVNCKETGMSGWEVEKILGSKYKIQPELSGWNHLLFLCTPGNKEEEYQALVKALEDISKYYRKDKVLKSVPADWNIIPEQVLSPREAFFASKETVPLENGLGKISGEMLAPYPPGIPVLAPGERINATVLAVLKDIKSKGVKVQGPQDSSLETIVVIK